LLGLHFGNFRGHIAFKKHWLYLLLTLFLTIVYHTGVPARYDFCHFLPIRREGLQKRRAKVSFRAVRQDGHHAVSTIVHVQRGKDVGPG
jgi:hypothetical protein